MKMRNNLMRYGFLAVALIGLGFSGAASAGKKDCPVGLLDEDVTLDDEFGNGTEELTRCIEKRKKVKVVVQINNFCRNAVGSISDCPITRAYALGNIDNMIKDYEITHGMERGKDYEIVAVVHSGGGDLMLTDTGIDGSGNLVSGRNKFEGQVQALLRAGVRFFFCQNTTRAFVNGNKLPTTTESPAGATGELITVDDDGDGVAEYWVEYTTAGVTAIADFQRDGYSYVQP
jgi:intracellular sulfur oxidation DsrE/DsrF family protein